MTDTYTPPPAPTRDGPWSFSVPYPPSVNEYWRAQIMLRTSFSAFVRAIRKPGATVRDLSTHLRPQPYLSRAGKTYRRTMAAACLHARVAGELPEQPILGALSLRAIAHPPVLQRRRDIDNLHKALLDAMVYAEVMLDDVQINDARIRWGDPAKTPTVRIVIARSDTASVSDHAWLYGRPEAAIATA